MDFRNILDFLLNSGLPLLIVACIIVVGLLAYGFLKLWPIINELINKLMPESMVKARGYINNNISLKLEEISKECLLFDSESLSTRFYFKRQLSNKATHKAVRKTARNKSLIIEGKPGVGKSSYIKDLFVSYNKYHKVFSNSRRAIYFDYKSIINLVDNKNEFKKQVDRIKNAKYRKIMLIFDGVDEIGVDRFTQLVNEVIPRIREVQSNVIFGISVREAFVETNQVIFDDLSIHMNHYILKEWDEKSGKTYGYKLLKLLKRTYDASSIERVKKAIGENCPLEFVVNPLLLKMYIYTLLNDKEVESKINGNRFSLYECFLTQLIYRSHTRNYDEAALHRRMNELTEKCYAAYGSKLKILDTNADPKALFKPNKMLIHETIFEFFVARHFINVITGKIDSSKMFECQVKALENEYPNEYADFITSAINRKSNEEKREFINTLCRLYSYTLEDEYRVKFAELVGLVNAYNYQNKKVLEGMCIKNNRLLLIIKTQIVFRLGRMNYAEDKPNLAEILKFLYMYDKHIQICINDDYEYYLAIFKRGCAISASLIGAEDIEIDYVSQMLNFGEYAKNYKPDYDLANRSHTIIFYGDIKSQQSIFEFKDQNTSISCRNAIEKRIKRLSINPKDPNQSITKLDYNSRKKYFFRLFDLATIYTFIQNRGEHILSDEQYKAIEKCFVNYVDQSEMRHQLMEDIKKQILYANK